MKSILNTFRGLAQYPSIMIGGAVILALMLVGVYALVAIPYDEAVRLWRGGEDVWYQNPKNAPPVWYNWFTPEDLPATIDLNSAEGEATRTIEGDGEEIILEYTFDFQADAFPPDIIYYIDATYPTKNPFASITWLTPDGREIRVADFGVERSQSYRVVQDTKLQRRLGGVAPNIGLFADPNSDPADPTPLKGTYTFRVATLTFEEGSDIEGELVVYGLVHGWAGTDHLRRDLMVPLLWGTPIALAFGLMAALGTTVATMIIAAIGVWYGGWVDELIQRITEVNLVLPFLSILIMVGYFYSRSIWVILGVTILLSIFTGGIKGYRAMFLQVKESTYIEAARAYGAGDFRIIFRYLIPRIVPLLIPGLVSAIPAYVFLEASLAVLGLGDPILPTWGKIINDAQINGALYRGQYYWILEPAVLLMITGLGFAIVGYSLDRIFNPRLRGL